MSTLHFERSGVKYSLIRASVVKACLVANQGGMSWDIFFSTDSGLLNMPGVPSLLVDKATWFDYLNTVTSVLGMPDAMGNVAPESPVFAAVSSPGTAASGFVMLGSTQTEFIRNEWRSVAAPQTAATAAVPPTLENSDIVLAHLVQSFLRRGPKSIMQLTELARGSVDVTRQQVYSALVCNKRNGAVRRVGRGKYALRR